MFNLEIEKMRKSIQMKVYRYLNQLRENYPQLLFQKFDGATPTDGPKILVRAEMAYSEHYEYSLELHAGAIVTTCLKTMVRLENVGNPSDDPDDLSIQNFNNIRKGKEIIDEMHSYLFKTVLGKIDNESALYSAFMLCRDEFLRRMSDSYLHFFVEYKRILRATNSRKEFKDDWKDRFINATIKTHLPEVSTTGRDELKEFCRHEKQLVDAMEESRPRQIEDVTQRVDLMMKMMSSSDFVRQLYVDEDKDEPAKKETKSAFLSFISKLSNGLF